MSEEEREDKETEDVEAHRVGRSDPGERVGERERVGDRVGETEEPDVEAHRQDIGRQDIGRQDVGRQDIGRQDVGRQDIS